MSNRKGQATISLQPLKVQGTAYFQMRFAVQHLMAAAEFSRSVGRLERTHQGEELGPFFDEILWNATACILCSVASLEAYANEFFIDRGKNLPDLPEPAIGKLWEYAEKSRILEKFNLALHLKGRDLFEPGKNPYQNANVLIELRNALTHFKPEWEWEQKGAHSKLSDKLSHMFKPSRFLKGNARLFPMGWASHSCTRWAVRTTVDFAKKFESVAGLTPKFDQFKERLKP